MIQEQKYYELTVESSDKAITTKSGNINELIDKVGANALCLAITMNNIQYHCSAEYAHKPHIMFQAIKNFIGAFITDDPSYLHFHIARAAIKNVNESLLSDAALVDRVAREIITLARLIHSKLVTPNIFKNITDYTEVNNPFSVINGNNDEMENEFEKNGCYIWDNVWLELLTSSGKYGEESAKKAKEHRKDKLKQYKESPKIAIGLWVNLEVDNNEPFYHSDALILLAENIIRDKVLPRINFKNKHVPAVTTDINTSIAIITSTRNKYEEEEGQLKLRQENNIIGLTMPTIQSSIADAVFRGVRKLKTVTAHRFTRYIINRTFDQYVAGHTDYRVLDFERGATEIAEDLNLNGKQHVTDIKDIVHAYAFTHFEIGNFSGNFIQLSKYKSETTHRLERYRIIVGDPLAPFYGEKDLLIPIFSDPPLVNPTQSYASQYNLQLLLGAEFSKQSIDLHQHGAIYIPEQLWKNLGEQSGLNQNTLNKVYDRWTQDGTDTPKFLEKIDSDFYTLGPTHQKALESLKEQGKRRLKGRLVRTNNRSF